MWYHSLLILILYLTLFHILICTFEWYNHIFDLDYIVSPFSLNSKRLRSLLDVRGIFDAGIIEKHDLVELTDGSGPVNINEVEALVARDLKSTNAATEESRSQDELARYVEEFSGSEHFYEQVEDSKDTIWLVKVVAQNSRVEIRPSTWLSLVRKFDRFGVRFGVLYCWHDPELCEHRRWNTSRFLLTLPGPWQSFGRRQDVPPKISLHRFSGIYSERSLTEWIYAKASQNKGGLIRKLETTNELSYWLLNHCSVFDQVCLLLVSTLTLPPFFLAALSVRFNGRLKVAVCSPGTLNDSAEGRALLSVDENHPALSSSSSPSSSTPSPNESADESRMKGKASTRNDRANFNARTSSTTGRYFILSGRSRTAYGLEPEQYLNFDRLQGYLKWLTPNLNDVFVFTLFVTNALALVSIFDLARASPLQRSVHFFCTFIKYNAVLLAAWIIISGLVNYQLCSAVVRRASYVLRYYVTSCRPLRRLILLAGVRSFGDPTTRSYWSKLHLACFLAFNCFVFCLRRRFWPSSLSDGTTIVWSQWSTFYANVLSRTGGIGAGPFEQTMPPPPPRFLGLTDFWSQRSAFLPTTYYSATSTDLSPDLIKLIEKCRIENVRAYPAIPYDYILRLETIVYRHKWCRSGANVQRRRCLRCSLATHLHMKHVLLKLRKTPCSKCHFSPSTSHVDQQQPSDIGRFDGSSSTGNNQHQAAPFSTRFNCPVCLDAYKNGETICRLPCNHSYHQRCILAWLFRDQPTCPFCRYPAYFLNDVSADEDLKVA